MRRWWPPLAWAALILTLTSTPASDLPSTGVSDKIEHAGAYLVLAVLTARARLHPPRLRDAVLLALGISIFGAVDEWHQRFIPGRYPDPADWVADTVGAVVGMAGAAYARLALGRRLARESV